MMQNDVPKRPWFGWFKIWRLNRALDYQLDLCQADARFESLKADLNRIVNTSKLNAALVEHNIDALNRLNSLELRAEELGMSLPTYEEYQRAQIRLIEKRGDADIEVDKTERLDQLKLEFKKLSDKLDLEKERESFRIQIEAALAYKYLDIEAARRTVDILSTLHDQKYAIAFSGRPRLVVLEQLKDIEVLINGARDGLTRLVQGGNGEDAGGSSESPVAQRFLGKDLATGQE